MICWCTSGPNFSSELQPVSPFRVVTASCLQTLSDVRCAISDPHWGGLEADDHAAFVGSGTKWANPIKKPDVEALRSEPDIERAYQQGGWREAANLLYREHLQDQGLDPRELRGKDLVCTCKLTDPCHVDVLLDLANLVLRLGEPDNTSKQR